MELISVEKFISKEHGHWSLRRLSCTMYTQVQCLLNWTLVVYLVWILSHVSVALYEGICQTKNMLSDMLYIMVHFQTSVGRTQCGKDEVNAIIAKLHSHWLLGLFFLPVLIKMFVPQYWEYILGITQCKAMYVMNNRFYTVGSVLFSFPSL